MATPMMTMMVLMLLMMLMLMRRSHHGGGDDGEFSDCENSPGPPLRSSADAFEVHIGPTTKAALDQHITFPQPEEKDDQQDEGEAGLRRLKIDALAAFLSIHSKSF